MPNTNSEDYEEKVADNLAEAQAAAEEKAQLAADVAVESLDSRLTAIEDRLDALRGVSNPNRKSGAKFSAIDLFMVEDECMTLEAYNRQRAKETTECPKASPDQKDKTTRTRQ